MTATVYAKGSDTQINYVVETTPGTTPATPTMIQLPFVKFDVDFDQTTLEDTSVFADRMEHNVIAGQRKVAGTLQGNLSHTNFNAIFPTALFSSWATNVLKIGTTLNTITLERWHGDIGTGFVSTGCFADKLAFKLTAAGLAEFTATIAGINGSTETTPLSAAPTAPAVEVPFSLVSATLQEGGVPIAYLTTIDITIDNKAQVIDAMGSQVPLSYVPGLAKVTGQAAGWVPDSSLFTKYLNQTGTSLSVVLTDGTNTVTITLPNIRYTSAKMPVQGQGAVVQTLQFTAIKDATSGTNIEIQHS
jgi:hypothetical protein